MELIVITETVLTADTPSAADHQETDPLAAQSGIEDTRYLTKLHDPDTLIPQSAEQQQRIIRSITQNTLNQYVAEGNDMLFIFSWIMTP